MWDCRAWPVFGVVHTLAIPVLLKNSFIDRVEKRILPLEQKMVPYNSKPEPILADKDLPDVQKDQDRTQDALISGDDSRRLVCVAGQTKIQPISKVIVLVATEMRGLAQIGPLLGWYSMQAWRTALDIIDAFANRPFNVIVLQLANEKLSLVKHLQIATAYCLSSATIQNKYDDASPYIPITPLCESLILVHYQRRVERL